MLALFRLNSRYNKKLEHAMKAHEEAAYRSSLRDVTTAVAVAVVLSLPLMTIAPNSAATSAAEEAVENSGWQIAHHKRGHVGKRT
jgi:hypothetical protein